MGLIDALNKLDAKVLPRLARGFGRVAGAAAAIRVRPLTLVAGVLVLAVAATVIWKLGEPKSEPGTGPYYRVGVTNGMDIDQYIADSNSQLQRLATGTRTADPVYALVSLSSYLDADAVTTLVAAAGPQLVTITAHARLPLPRIQTETVPLAAQSLPGDLRASLARAGAREAENSAKYAAKAGAEQNPGLRKVYEDNARIDAAEADAFRDPNCACIFALVVRGAPAVLTRLAAADGVRVVDPAPEVTTITSSTTFVALLPEQSGQVESPPDDALNGTATVPVVTQNNPPGN